MHSLYLFLKALVDLSESIYQKLNYFKSNYKSCIIRIFDEKDHSTIDSSLNWRFENKFLQRFLEWAGSIFGSAEQVFKVYKDKALSQLDYYAKNIQNSKRSTVAILNILSIIGLCLLFLIYFQFT